ncbi:MAG: bifunctional phosphopantothenoylcysteine decarboxylase/phosphopantothenate--cysteine ligase CoaBC [Candidatus Aminicenantes bacterium]|nr:bifunctional phosphopantothenoylcysteine decarboxylase/phosphopantothenate--cysteine ligase CoaBC [Candidatus Aminicenantes bacterium]
MDKIALGVCSSISVYKACEVLRGFQKSGLQVRVIMTEHATRLIQPLLFKAISGLDVLLDPFEELQGIKMPHVDEAKDVSLLVVAPATANIIGKFACGIADDFLSTFYMVVKCPVLMAPAMNERMYMHEQTQLNIKKLKAMGVHFVEPDKGYLACGDEGWGRLTSPDGIVAEGVRLLGKSRTLKGKSVLVTAGPTREYLDPVRFLTNRSTGRMGYAVAREALKRGAEVVLVSGPTPQMPPTEAQLISVQTAAEMEQAVVRKFDQSDIVVMAAAVSDFKFKAAAAQKIKKKALPAGLEIEPTCDILKSLGKKKKNQILVGFAAETENMEDNALRKAQSKNCDFIVANNVGEAGIGFESDFNRVSLVFRDGRAIHSERKSKAEISHLIWDEIEALIGKKN